MFKDFAKIEYDYGFCQARCKQGYQKFFEKEEWNPFDGEFGQARKSFYNNIYYNSKSCFFMSDKQKDLFSEFLDLSMVPTVVIGSAFKNEHISSMLDLRYKRRNGEIEVLDKAMVIDGNGGWHSEGKGVFQSMAYCKRNNIYFDLVKSSDYESMLKVMSKYKTLIHHPVVDDTCPRVTIEAKIIGLENDLNEQCQHKDEPWFKDFSLDDTLEHMGQKKTEFQNFIKDQIDYE